MKKIALVVLLALVIVICSGTLVHAQVYGPVFRVEYNTERQGADIRQGFPASLGECMNNCVSSSGCRAFTWVDVNQQPPNYNNDSPLCWLKNSVPGRRKESGLVSGIRQQ